MLAALSEGGACAHQRPQRQVPATQTYNATQVCRAVHSAAQPAQLTGRHTCIRAVQSWQWYAPEACAAATCGSRRRLQASHLRARSSGSHKARAAGPAEQISVANQQVHDYAEPVHGEDKDDVPLELCQARHVILEPDFLPFAEQLRGVFDERFNDPRRTHTERFLWDYWHVPNQYTLIRTQPQVYFDEALYSQLQDSLLAYGERRLGCRAITPIWMSYYVDGCCQELHTDSPHGPFAFVVSLTRWEGRAWSGGETMILRPRVLDYWSQHDCSRGLEQQDLVTLVEPHFNQLTVFDPRFPHGVRPVHGTRDPMHSRLVLHGWFTEPAPFFDGPLPEEDAEVALNEVLGPLFEELGQLPPVSGILTLRMGVSMEGAVQGLHFVADTLIVLPGGEVEEAGGPAAVRALVHHAVREHLMGAAFPPCSGDTDITLPLVFE